MVPLSNEGNNMEIFQELDPILNEHLLIKLSCTNHEVANVIKYVM